MKNAWFVINRKGRRVMGTELRTEAWDFGSIRKADGIYVDKTKQILDLVNAGKYVCLSRPMGFGKTLLLDTIKTLFSNQGWYVQTFTHKRNREDLFIGLYIHDKWDFSKEFPVIKISSDLICYPLSISCNAKGKLNIDKYIIEKLNKIANKNKLTLHGRTLTEKISYLVERLGQKMVVLINSGAMLNNIDILIRMHKRNDWAEIIFSEIFNMLRVHDKYIHFVFMIDQCPPPKTDMFLDLTLDERFNNLLGFTQKEIEENFGEYIDARAAKEGLSRNGLLEKMNDWYGGYSWDGKTKLYHPASVFALLGNYDMWHNFYVWGWDRSGTLWSDSLWDRLDGGKRKFNIYYEKEKANSKTLMMYNAEDKVKEVGKSAAVASLFQSGCLTVKEKIGKGASAKYLLGIPNWATRYEISRNLLKPLGDSNV
jgi:hypothetical protein